MMKKMTFNVPNLRYGFCVGHYGLCVGLVGLLSVLSVGQVPAEADRKAGERMTVSIKDVEYAFRWCPPGKFMMGSPLDESARDGDERPHEVTLSRGFWIMEMEVTQGMWESVMGYNPGYPRGGKLPVETVSWNNCQEFIKKLNELKSAPAGYRFLLPTEAQWEYACRAGTTTAYHFGNSLSAEQANFSSNVGQTKDVGSYPSNAWGLKDMHGNVWEWCLDWHGAYPSGAVTDPMGPDMGSLRVIRGGGWNYDARHCRSAYRNSSDPASGYGNLGLRLSLVSSP